MIAYVVAVFLSCIAISYISIDTNSTNQESGSSKNIKVLKGDVSGGYNSSFSMTDSRSDSYAKNMVLYSNSVTKYAKANPAATGSIANASLGLPTWFIAKPWSNYISGGYVYTYTTDATTLAVPAIALSLSKATDAYILAGESRNGTFYSLNGGDNTSVVFPVAAGIPNKSPVIITNSGVVFASNAFINVVSTTAPSGTHNLTAIGTVDWVAYGAENFDVKRKASGPIAFSGLTCINGGGINYDGTAQYFSWSDASPAPAASNAFTEFYGSNCPTGGIQFSVQSSTISKKVKVYLDSQSTTMSVTASFADGSATPVTFNYPAVTTMVRNYIEIDFASSGTSTLIVSALPNGGGLAQITAAALQNN